MKLLIGDLWEKIAALVKMAGSAHLGRDKDLVKKAMDTLKQLAEETKLEYVQRWFENFERRFSQWSMEFSSGTPPGEREIALILAKPDIGTLAVVL